jgi:histidine triad (HIT) family protein
VADRSECLFCRVADGGVPADVVHSGDAVLALRDINPQAPTHVLVIPRAHHENVVELARDDPATLAELVRVARMVAEAEGDGQFRLVFNTGAVAGQRVFHVHGHVLAGRSMGWPPG